MYNPSRGGVRGGADQFTWESVKNDKHRENYLGHSLMAPVGRWQKGKDLSWYAKERKDSNAPEKPHESELASIKRAEEEAMLIALGHNIVRKTQTLSKEDMSEALKRNTNERDAHNIERVDGVGASSQRVALLSGIGKDSRQKSEGVMFENYGERNTDAVYNSAKEDKSPLEERRKIKKKSKKYKKEKKHKKHKESYDSESSDGSLKHKTKHTKHKKHKESYNSESSENSSKHWTKDKKYALDNNSRKSSKVKSLKKSKYGHKDDSYDDFEKRHHSNSHQESHKRHKEQSDFVKRRRHDTSESD